MRGSDYPCINYEGPVEVQNFSLASVAHQKESDFNEDFGNLVFLITAKGQCTPKTLINDKMNKNKQFTKRNIFVCTVQNH